jgi:hypothetical protein
MGCRGQPRAATRPPPQRRSSPASRTIKETSFVYHDRRGFFVLSGQKSGKSEQNKGKSGFAAVDRLLRGPIFCVQSLKKSQKAGVLLLVLCAAKNKEKGGRYKI